MHRADKAALRQELTAARRARPPAQVASARREVCAAVVARCITTHWRCVGAYVPLRGEPGSTELLDALSGHGIRVLVPVLLADHDLDWAEWAPATAQVGVPLGVSAISTADAVFVPALAVARDGARLGRGGGSYDRALSRLPAGAVTAALLFDGELVDTLPTDDWDVAVTAVVTPDGWQDLALG